MCIYYVHEPVCTVAYSMSLICTVMYTQCTVCAGCAQTLCDLPQSRRETLQYKMKWKAVLRNMLSGVNMHHICFEDNFWAFTKIACRLSRLSVILVQFPSNRKWAADCYCKLVAWKINNFRNNKKIATALSCAQVLSSQLGSSLKKKSPLEMSDTKCRMYSVFNNTHSWFCSNCTSAAST